MADEVANISSVPPTAWRELPLQFATHAAVASAMFLIVGGAALGLQLFIHWLESYDFAHWAVLALVGVKWGLFFADLILFSIFMVRSFVYHAKLFLTMEVN